MNPSRLFILRPVATTLLMLAIVIAGAIAYRMLPVAALPQVDYPTIQVYTFYPGASPDVMTSSVTAPLERQFGQIPGVKQMTSTSSGGASIITLQFDLVGGAGRGGAGRAIGHQCRLQPGPFGPAGAARLQQGQSGRRADRDPGADFRVAAAAAGPEPGGYALCPEALAGARGRPGDALRRTAAGRAHPGQSAGAGIERAGDGGAEVGDRRRQREEGQGQFRRSHPRLQHRRQRPAALAGGVPRHRRRLARRRADPPLGRGRGWKTRRTCASPPG